MTQDMPVQRTQEPANQSITQDTSVQRTQELASIGTAWMEKNRTIVLQLRAETDDGIIGDALLRYPPRHPQYTEILEHLGGLAPGEYKSVKSWPETL